MAQVVIFGAGKIARGFLSQICFSAGVSFAFVEANADLVKALNEAGRYTVHFLGDKARDLVVEGFEAVSIDDGAGIARVAADASCFFTSVGGKNLGAVAPAIEWALHHVRKGAVNVVTCENWKRPAAILAQAVRPPEGLAVGFAEAVVMRSAMEPTKEQLARDALTVCVQDYHTLPVDAQPLVCPLPAIPEIVPTEGFKGFLERKFYTYNAANGTASFVGAFLGHTVLAEAARDERVDALLTCVYRETGQALSKRHGIPLDEQLAFSETSRAKLRDRGLPDTVERNARDPLRKLGRDDRLVGSALLAEGYGIVPEGLATAIAAALHYENPDDPSAVKLAAMLREQGSGYVLDQVCGLQGDPLRALVLEKEKELLSWRR